MDKIQFIKRVQFLHNVCGVPYSEIGKRLNVTGQYISLMMSDRKPITNSILQKAAQCDMLNSGICGGDINE